ncbi:thioesterase family protein [Sphingomonas sp. SUN039]|uniref:thioesterase family protein n=1 Tax=Sphingomonas sp. SUN039 TaxID=2937787 RepID=UPI0021647CAD|nr:thioesterase family protein [Sphingomonas sp. SUN039]UVO53139.1 thioesterase family protein [Sphingomonas sp. SUN039]
MSLPLVADGRATIGDDWLQGRTAYGGVSAGIALTTAKAAYPDLPPLRSAQIAFVGPLAGDITATPTLLRRGKNSAFIGVDIAGSDGVGLRALFLFMANRESSIRHGDLSHRDAPSPDGTKTDGTSIGPGFLSNFELAKGGDPLPGNWLRWVRLKERDALDAEVELVAVADALPPAAMSLAKAWGPISTTTWQLNLVGVPETRDGWWLLGAEALHTADGNSSQTMTIWNRDGAAVATATQSVALFI